MASAARIAGAAERADHGLAKRRAFELQADQQDGEGEMVTVDVALADQTCRAADVRVRTTFRYRQKGHTHESQQW
jgi:D-hexose-6-phosphate mutarotase